MIKLSGGKCIARFVKISALKTRRVINQIRGLPVKEAYIVLKLMPYRACLPILKALRSSVFNLVGNSDLDLSQIVVREARVDQAKFLKRARPHAQGRAFPIKKHYSHITSAF
uniref:Large ribosomal subunit protein uL22c n=1 Tax=Lepocinclis tripteris TaxID=135494 RepID=A0A3G3LL12_9EUGL|nr:ribosomal protein L22 [Lepocinclis tripteris]AYQ93390.1 ribosomal protein L22 [Lepocinclis tripteris]